MLPRELSKQVPNTHLMSEEEWRRVGGQNRIFFSLDDLFQKNNKNEIQPGSPNLFEIKCICVYKVVFSEYLKMYKSLNPYLSMSCILHSNRAQLNATASRLFLIC
ncbi:hypothetical protein LEMLEM_LOCUS927 [Lemmus lemmus]